MEGATYRTILKMGKTYTIQNPTGGSGGTDTPDYEEDGAITGVIERRSIPQFFTDSAGIERETDVQIRSVIRDDSLTFYEMGEENQYPSRIIHPDGRQFLLVDKFPEDKGVSVLTVVSA